MIEGGERGARLPTVSQAVAKQPARLPAKVETRRHLPPIEPGSALITSAETGLKGARVYVDEFNLAYNCVLNLMDIRTGVNKFYKMQLLVHTKAQHFSVWKSWGRVGGGEGDDSYGRRSSGSMANDSLMHRHGQDLVAAKKEFHEKFREVRGSLAIIKSWVGAAGEKRHGREVRKGNHVLDGETLVVLGRSKAYVRPPVPVHTPPHVHTHRVLMSMSLPANPLPFSLPTSPASLAHPPFNSLRGSTSSRASRHARCQGAMR